MDTKVIIWYNLSIIVLSLLLYKPVKNFIYTGRIRKAEQKLGRDTTEEEKKDIEKKTKPLIVAIVILFSLLFNYMLAGKLYNIK